MFRVDRQVGLIDEFYGYGIGAILFVGTLKFIKMLRFNNRFAILTLTLRVVYEDLSGFLSVFFLVFFAFVQVGLTATSDSASPCV